MADLLPDEDIATALEALPDWRREGDALTREVNVPSDSQGALEDAVSRAADEMNHHPDLHRSSDAVTFRLSTHSAGGVTAKDVELAAKIDQLLSGGARDTGSG